MKILDFDYLVVGSGIAGLTSALHLSPHGRVLVVTKRAASECNTLYAQGGVACVVADGDTFDKHVADTLDAGAGLCDEAVVRRIVEAGPARLAEIESFGLRFARSQDGGSSYDLGKEGGHSERRILHSGDATGRELESVVLERVLQTPNIVMMEHVAVIDLITTRWLGGTGENRCVGAYVLERRTGAIFAIRAPWVVMASGGGGKVYLYTSNPDVATGDGVAIAWRAGAAVANMELIQFHPTCLYHPDAKSFLVSEAVRGEGGELVDVSTGRPFMTQYDKRGSLAPRDIVARAIDTEMKERGVPFVGLDIRHRSRSFLRDRFPTIYETCLGYGIDMANEIIPVVPAAHYCCGGVKASVEGVTGLPGLLAVGEVACTGLHGANRLASNSLLEALVCSYEMSRYVVARPVSTDVADIELPPWHYGDAVPSDEAVVVAHNWNEVRTCMWDYVGIVRTDKRLARARRRVQNLRQEIREYYFDYLVTADTLELRNISDVAELIIRSAIMRHESRGLHYTLDYRKRSQRARDSIVAGRHFDDGGAA